MNDEYLYQIRLQRYGPDNGFIDYQWGPDSNIDRLFERVAAYLDTETISDEYRNQVAEHLKRCATTKIKDLLLPYLMSFCVDVAPGYSDLWIVELV